MALATALDIPAFGSAGDPPVNLITAPSPGSEVPLGAAPGTVAGRRTSPSSPHWPSCRRPTAHRRSTSDASRCDAAIP